MERPLPRAEGDADDALRARGADLPERGVEEDGGREEAKLLVPDVGGEPRGEGVPGGVFGVELGERRTGAACVGEARRHADVVPVAVREVTGRVGDVVVRLAVEHGDEEVPRVREKKARRELEPAREDLASCRGRSSGG